MQFAKTLISPVVVLVAITNGATPQPRSENAAPVRVLVPDPDNLQYLSFWLAKAKGYFRDEGLDLQLSIPDHPHFSNAQIVAGDADIAVLPPPMYLELIAEEFPIVLVANLPQNDPINLVVRRSVMEERKLSAEAPIAQRLQGLKGLRVGVAPNPPARLRALFGSQGMDADKDIEMVIVPGRRQNAAFADKEVDALYAHTPYLEKAIVDQDAVVLVNQSGGEVPVLATRQIHALVFTREFATRSPSVPLRSNALLDDQLRSVTLRMTARTPPNKPRMDRPKLRITGSTFVSSLASQMPNATTRDRT